MIASCFSPPCRCTSSYSFLSLWKMSANSSLSDKIWMTVRKKRPLIFSTSFLQSTSLIFFECFSRKIVEMISGNCF